MEFIRKLTDKVKTQLVNLLQEHPPKALRREAEINHLKSLPEISYPDDFMPGVLLSDQIDHYAVTFKMIDPYHPEKLKPAAYELSVGDLYSIGGNTHVLAKDPPNNEIVISPFEVVIIQTLERLNLPEFLIARWNVRVRWAYQGLLWVGAAQVDPGFRGFLSCPLYNLSDKPVRLHYGDEIAVIDFVTTTPPNDNSRQRRYNPYKRSRVLFEDYGPDNLQSALATQANERLAGVEKSVTELKSRVDASVTVITTAIGIVVTGLALFVSRQVPNIVTYWSPSVLMGAAAFITALWAYAHSLYRHVRESGLRKVMFVEVLAVIILMGIFILVWIKGVPSEPKGTTPAPSQQELLHPPT